MVVQVLWVKKEITVSHRSRSKWRDDDAIIIRMEQIQEYGKKKKRVTCNWLAPPIGSTKTHHRTTPFHIIHLYMDPYGHYPSFDNSL